MATVRETQKAALAARVAKRDAEILLQAHIDAVTDANLGSKTVWNKAAIDTLADAVVTHIATDARG